MNILAWLVLGLIASQRKGFSQITQAETANRLWDGCFHLFRIGDLARSSTLMLSIIT